MVFSQSLNEGDQSTKEVKAVIGYLTESLSILELFFRSKRPKLVLIFSSNGTNPENAECVQSYKTLPSQERIVTSVTFSS